MFLLLEVACCVGKTDLVTSVFFYRGQIRGFRLGTYPRISIWTIFGFDWGQIYIFRSGPYPHFPIGTRSAFPLGHICVFRSGISWDMFILSTDRGQIRILRSGPHPNYPTGAKFYSFIGTRSASVFGMMALFPDWTRCRHRSCVRRKLRAKTTSNFTSL